MSLSQYEEIEMSAESNPISSFSCKVYGKSFDNNNDSNLHNQRRRKNSRQYSKLDSAIDEINI